MTENTMASHKAGAVNTIETRADKYLTFKLVDEEYGLEILKVQEIIGIMNVTSIPQMPEFVRGVINLRGKIIPVVDLRLKFGLKGKEDTDRTSIIVVRLDCSGLDLTMGIIVDEVSEVLNVEEEQIEPPPSFGSEVNTDFIFGMGKVDQRVLTMLDIDKVFGETENASMEKAEELEYQF